MGASAGQFFPADGGAATPTRIASTAIHPGLAAVVAVHALQIPKVAEGGATGADADGENVHESLSQAIQLLQGEFTRWCEWLKPRHEQAFIGIDVADPSHQRLIQKRCLDRSLAAFEPLAQVAG